MRPVKPAPAINAVEGVGRDGQNWSVALPSPNDPSLAWAGLGSHCRAARGAFVAARAAEASLSLAIAGRGANRRPRREQHVVAGPAVDRDGDG